MWEKGTDENLPVGWGEGLGGYGGCCRRGAVQQFDVDLDKWRREHESSESKGHGKGQGQGRKGGGADLGKAGSMAADSRRRTAGQTWSSSVRPRWAALMGSSSMQGRGGGWLRARRAGVSLLGPPDQATQATAVSPRQDEASSPAGEGGVAAHVQLSRSPCRCMVVRRGQFWDGNPLETHNLRVCMCVYVEGGTGTGWLGGAERQPTTGCTRLLLLLLSTSARWAAVAASTASRRAGIQVAGTATSALCSGAKRTPARHRLPMGVPNTKMVMFGCCPRLRVSGRALPLEPSPD